MRRSNYLRRSFTKLKRDPFGIFNCEVCLNEFHGRELNRAGICGKCTEEKLKDDDNE